MIEINLLPEELRPKVKKEAPAPIPIPVKQLKKILILVPVAIGLLVIVHLYLAVTLIVKSSMLRSWENKWAALAPQRKILEEFQKQYALADTTLAKELLNQRISWADKLNRISMDLPGGIWLTEVSVANKVFTLKGTAVSLQTEEVSMVNKLLNNLKKDEVFFRNFSVLEMNSVQAKRIGSQEVVEFLLTGSLK